MAWEDRNGNRYYYRKRRIGDRVVSEYMGGGELASLFVMIDEGEQERRQWEREATRAERQEQQELDHQVDEVISLARTLADATLLAAGYHRHKGQWRKRRERDTDDPGRDQGAGQEG